MLAGLRPDTGVWFWGEGRQPRMPSFHDLYGLSGAVVAAVDLVRGIGRLAGLDVIDVPGATGDLDTNYRAKARPRPRRSRTTISCGCTWRRPTRRLTWAT